MSNDARRDLKNVMVVALLDGEVGDDEKRFIESLRLRLNIDETELRELIAQVRAEPKRLHLPRDQQAEQSLQLLIDTAAADGEISDRERRVLLKVAKFLDIDESQLDRMLPGAALCQADEAKLAADIEELYANFASWDDATRRARIEAVASFGRGGAEALLGVLESYRQPDGMDDALEMKALVAERIGRLGDSRAVYYFAQQISIGDSEDEISNPALRGACAEAMGRLVGQSFSRDDDGVQAGRLWWQQTGRKDYNHLAF